MAIFNLFNLPTHFKVDGLLHELEAVQVFNFAPCAQIVAGLAHRHVGIAPEAALLHVAVANANPSHNFVQLFGIGHRLIARANVRLGHNFQKRCARAVQVNAALANEVFVQRFARVFFQVRAHQTNGFLFVADKERHLATLNDWDFKLTDLIALGQVWVEIIFAGKNTLLCNVRTHRQAQFNGALYSTFVHDGQ